MKKTENKKEQSRRHFIKLAVLGTTLLYAPVIPGKGIFSSFKPSDKEKFLNACARGEVTIVGNLLKNDPGLIQAKDGHGRSAFAIALLHYHKTVGDHLKDSGYKTDLHETVLDLNWDQYNDMIGEKTKKTEQLINADHPIGGTVMWAAAAGGAGKQIWRVYANGGDPNLNTKQGNGSTPLQKALRYPDLKIAELTAASLLSNDADPNPNPNAEPSPLHIAAERGSHDLVEMLVRLGANVDALDREGKTAKDLADYFGHTSVFKLLKNHESIPRTCRTSRTAFDKNLHPYQLPQLKDIPLYLRGNFVGTAHRDLEALQEAVARDPRMVHSVATTSESAVEAGAHMGRKDIVEFLINHGAPYALPTAVMLNDFTTVRTLLEGDPDRIHERGAHDFALLWYPIIGRNGLDMLQLLLDHGADIEEQHFLGTTALHFASIGGNTEAVAFLLENGANINRKGRKFGDQPRSSLALAKDEKTIAYLKSKGAE